MSAFLFWVAAALSFLYIGLEAVLVFGVGLWSWPAFLMSAFFIGLSVVHAKNAGKP